MDVVILAADAYRDLTGTNIEYSGNVPKEWRAREILLASGLPHHLNAESLLKADERKIMRFELVRGRHNNSEKKTAGMVATNLTLYFDNCLRTQGVSLNDRGKLFFGRILGEVLDNCEIHGGKNATWYTQGHYQMGNDNLVGEMQLVFLSFGDTIYEGLKLETSEETRHRLEYMMQKQENALTKEWNEETIYTVLELECSVCCCCVDCSGG